MEDKNKDEPKEEISNSDLLMKIVEEKAKEYERLAKENPNIAKQLLLIALGLWWL